MLFPNSISQSFIVLVGLLFNLNPLFAAPELASTSLVECSHLWTTEINHKDQYSIDCMGSDKTSRVCDARYCHMGGRKGTPEAHSWNHELLFSNCHKLDHNKKVIPGKTFTIFPRSYHSIEEKKTIFAHGLEVSSAANTEAYFQCPWEQGQPGSNPFPWCNSCHSV